MRVIILCAVIVAAVFVVHAVQGERTAVWPIKVWTDLVPEYGCVIWPLQGYSVDVPIYVDLEKHPGSHGWYNVQSVTCRCVAKVGR